MSETPIPTAAYDDSSSKNYYYEPTNNSYQAHDNNYKAHDGSGRKPRTGRYDNAPPIAATFTQMHSLSAANTFRRTATNTVSGGGLGGGGALGGGGLGVDRPGRRQSTGRRMSVSEIAASFEMTSGK